MPLILPAPAKLNLFLHIIGRRTDGYHELQTAFQFLDFGDTLTIESHQDAEIYLNTDLPFPITENLIWRAAKCLQQHTGTHLGARIHLEKHIPMGSGLGGGSSNAATTLIALNRLWNTNVPRDKLAELGKTLGADVPIFVKGQASWGEGIGERLTAMDWPESWYIILTPPCTVNTAEIFAHPRLTRNSPRTDPADFLSTPNKTRNDFEPLVRELYPPIDAAFTWLSQFQLKPRLTGSGCALFAAVNSAEEASKILQQKPASFQGFIAKGMNRSPLFHVYIP